MLEMKAIMGPAAQRLRRGEACDTLSRIYGGIGGLSVEAREKLEMIAVDGPAAERLRQGASVSRVCRKLGIVTRAARERLQRLTLLREAEGHGGLCAPRAAAGAALYDVADATVDGRYSDQVVRTTTTLSRRRLSRAR
ncbi:hypothetical protein JZM24_17580 [Candidatus Sodalis endolongispinus]|uniref:Uncharacterized protein n=1 Tax=Candidatus Sodalis endolongispinus TaxID=2812662 RepID=A0ABS5YEQ4_9GAMM|nr:hypothetical protein [Candidatus Sodalis endolongispinus]MBT9433447.1 hypothetical protein [Candidatus Sodalis endolongispinus]